MGASETEDRIRSRYNNPIPLNGGRPETCSAKRSFPNDNCWLFLFCKTYVTVKGDYRGLLFIEWGFNDKGLFNAQTISVGL